MAAALLLKLRAFARYFLGSAPATLPDDDDLLREILLRLPSLPSSLPRASLVCRRWRRLVTDPRFLRRFRAHHQTPPLLGFFVEYDSEPICFPMLSPPDRIPTERFSLLECPSFRWRFIGCRHGLALIVDCTALEAVVWDPTTGHQRRVALPPELKVIHRHRWNGAVLGAAEDHSGGHGYSHCRLSAFKLVMMYINHEQTLAFACLYDSESGKWGNISSTAVSYPSSLICSSVMVGNAICWLLDFGGGIIEFDLDRQSLAVIQKPEEVHSMDGSCFHILRTEDEELALAFLSNLCIKLWARKANSGGVFKWVLRKTIGLSRLLSLNPWTQRSRIMGFDEDSNVIFLWMPSRGFMIHLKSMQFRNLRFNYDLSVYYPYTRFYTAGWGIVGGDDRVEYMR